MNWVFIFIILIIFSVIGYYIYKSTQIDPTRFIANDEYKTTDENTEVELILFSVDWCPHCLTTRTVWDSFKLSYKPVGFIVVFTEVDCDKYANKADSYNITEYPTIILVVNDVKYIYDAEISNDTLELFINTVMRENKIIK